MDYGNYFSVVHNDHSILFLIEAVFDYEFRFVRQYDGDKFVQIWRDRNMQYLNEIWLPMNSFLWFVGNVTRKPNYRSNCHNLHYNTYQNHVFLIEMKYLKPMIFEREVIDELIEFTAFSNVFKDLDDKLMYSDEFKYYINSCRPVIDSLLLSFDFE